MVRMRPRLLASTHAPCRFPPSLERRLRQCSEEKREEGRRTSDRSRYDEKRREEERWLQPPTDLTDTVSKTQPCKGDKQKNVDRPRPQAATTTASLAQRREVVIALPPTECIFRPQ